MTGSTAAPPSVSSPLFFQVQQAIKRGLDILVSAGLLVTLSPLMLAIAAAIRIWCGPPVLFTWKVVGQDGRPFTGHKFRTMLANADALKPDLMDRNEMSGPVFKMRDDPRVTPIGRWLRKFSLDELPQLWCVLKGDMSIVGPRPPLVYEYERFEEWQKRKLTRKPGMTSLWQVSGKPPSFDDWVRLDLEYIDRWSLGLDCQIFLKTIWIVITGKNY